MENRDILIAAVIVAVVAFSFSDVDVLTGNQVKEVSKSQPLIKVLNPILERGQNPVFEITFRPGDGCIDEEVHIHSYNTRYNNRGVRTAVQTLKPVAEDFVSGFRQSSFQYCYGDFVNNKFVFESSGSPFRWESGNTYETVFFYYPQSKKSASELGNKMFGVA